MYERTYSKVLSILSPGLELLRRVWVGAISRSGLSNEVSLGLKESAPHEVQGHGWWRDGAIKMGRNPSCRKRASDRAQQRREGDSSPGSGTSLGI